MKSFTALFPDTRIQMEPSSQSDEISVYEDGRWFVLSRETLSERELRLLDTAPSQSEDLSNWQGFISGVKTLDLDPQAQVRLLYFRVDQLPRVNQGLWLGIFESLFEEVNDAFFMEPALGIVVLNEPFKRDFSNLNKRLEPLDHDFNSKTQVLIGNPYHQDQDLYQHLQEEYTLFNQTHRSEPVLTLSKLLTHDVLAPSLLEYQILRDVQKVLLQEDIYGAMIRALWHHEGNISQSAQALYIHRNTLMYRLERFYQETGISLRNLDELMVCYLLLDR